MDLDVIMTRVNPLISRVLRSRLHWLMSGGLMLLTVTGRRTGRRYTIPVGYQRDGDRLVVLVSKAPRKQWWRNYESPGPAEVHVVGKTQPAIARLVPTQSTEFRRHVEQTLQRLPWLARQFGISYDRRTGLSEDQLARIAAEARVVAIEPSAS